MNHVARHIVLIAAGKLIRIAHASVQKEFSLVFPARVVEREPGTRINAEHRHDLIVLAGTAGCVIQGYTKLMAVQIERLVTLAEHAPEIVFR